MSLTFSDGEIIRCADCKGELARSRIPDDPFEAYTAGIELGKAVMDHRRRHEAEPVQNDQDERGGER